MVIIIYLLYKKYKFNNVNLYNLGEIEYLVGQNLNVKQKINFIEEMR